MGLTLDEPAEDDIVKEIKGLTFIVDTSLNQRYPEINIEYKNGVIFKGLKIYASGASSC